MAGSAAKTARSVNCVLGERICTLEGTTVATHHGGRVSHQWLAHRLSVLIAGVPLLGF